MFATVVHHLFCFRVALLREMSPLHILFGRPRWPGKSAPAESSVKHRGRAV